MEAFCHYIIMPICITVAVCVIAKSIADVLIIKYGSERTKSKEKF